MSTDALERATRTSLSEYEPPPERACYPAAQSSGTHDTLFAVAMASATEGWLCCRMARPGLWALGFGLVLHERAGTWAQAAPTNVHLTSVAMTSPDEGWATGCGGAILHWHNRVWTWLPATTIRALNCVAMISPQEGWIVGDTVAFHYAAGDWSPVPVASTSSVFGVATTPGSDAAWAVGTGTAPAPVIQMLRAGEGTG